jgi:hypothetical protein
MESAKLRMRLSHVQSSHPYSLISPGLKIIQVLQTAAPRSLSSQMGGRRETPDDT